MTDVFTRATTVTPLGGGRFSVELDKAYAIMGTKPNGGYMLACLGRAALAAVAEAGSPHTDVVSASAKYLASPDLGHAELEIDVLRTGRSASQVRARLVQDGAVGVDATFVLGKLSPAASAFWGGSGAPTLTPVEECQPTPFSGPGRGVSMLLDPAAGLGFGESGPVATGAPGELRAWFLPDDPTASIDTVTMLYVADAMPPATFTVLSTGWVPTLDLGVFVRALPAPGPLRARFRVGLIQDGFADEVFEAWDSTGRLVLQSTQLAALRIPEGTVAPD